MKRSLFFILIFILLCSFGAAAADMAQTENQYRSEMVMPDMPEVLNPNTWLDCGDLQLRLMGQPLVTKSISSLMASGDKSWLVQRIGIMNNSEEPVIWLDPQSFRVEEYYLNLLGRTYPLNSYMSAKSAAAYSLPPFYTIIQPGAELSTVIAFEVYGDVDGWIMTFSPFTREMDGPAESFSFTLPDVTRQ